MRAHGSQGVHLTSRDFCFWLQGYFEVSADATISSTQADCIRKHLALVFKHEIDPSMGGSEHQKDLNKIHATKPGRPTSELLRC